MILPEPALVVKCLRELYQMDKFSITKDGMYTYVKAADVQYCIGDWMLFEEGLIEAYFFIRGQIEGKRCFDEQMRIFAEQKKT